MKLSAYIQTFPREQRVAVRQTIAQAAGVTEPAVRHWCNGLRKIPSERMRAIEKVTAGLVTCYDMLPGEDDDPNPDPTEDAIDPSSLMLSEA